MTSFIANPTLRNNINYLIKILKPSFIRTLLNYEAVERNHHEKSFLS